MQRECWVVDVRGVVGNQKWLEKKNDNKEEENDYIL